MARTRRGAFRFLYAVLAAAAFGAAPVPLQAQTQDEPVVAAASSLKFALEEIAAAFTRDTGRRVKIAFGSSGNLTRQILQNAPFQIFFSADEKFILQLANEKRTVDEGALYAIGRLVLFAPTGSRLAVDADLNGLRAALAENRVERFAIANPEHAPYGLAAEQALRSQGLWETLRPRLVLGENIAQAAQFAATGSAQGGLFAYSLALSPDVKSRGTYVLIPENWHKPLRQRMALLKDAGETARAFYAFVQTPPARTIFRRYGFMLPGETS